MVTMAKEENSAAKGKGLTMSSFLETTSTIVISTLEKFFFWWGCIVARNPFKVILACIVLTGLCSIGFLAFYSEADVQKLYLPPDHIYLQNKAWRGKNFKDIGRGHFVLLTHDTNILTPESLLEMLEMHKRLRNVTKDGKSFRDVCLEIPITDILLGGDKIRKKRQTSEELDFTASATRKLTTTTSTASAAAAGEDLYEYINFYDESAAGEGKVEDTASASGPVDKEEDYGDYFNFYGNGEVEEEEKSEVRSKKKDDEEEEEEEEDLADELPPDIYCDIIDTLSDKCGEYSLLEIWKYDEKVIRALSQQDIIEAINSVEKSPVFGYDTNYTDYLGSKVYNATGHVIGAKASRSIFLATYDADNISKSKKKYGFEFDLADEFTMEWELILLETLDAIKADQSADGKGYDIFFRTARSFADEGSKPVEVDFTKMIGGYLLMFLYTSLLMGNFNFVEHRVYLANIGLVAVGMGMVISLGLTGAFGYFYTPLHGVLPFLALGIGIDNMFVILRCFMNIPEDEKETNSLVKNIGLTLKHAGVSISVTTLTDIAAFAVGAVAILPALKAFCVSSAIAIAAIFLLQASWFVAFLTLDQRRINARRDGFIPCLVHKKWNPAPWTQKDWGKFVCGKLSGLLHYRLFQGAILLITAGIFGMGMYGTLKIKIDFDPVLVLPPRSNLKLFIDESEDHYPTNGYGASVYTGGLPYTAENFEKLDAMVAKLDGMAHEGDIISYGEKLPLLSGSWDLSTGFWWTDLKDFMRKKRNVTDWRTTFADDSLRLHLSDYLHREEGAQDKINFEFEVDLECNVPAPNILASKLGAITFNDFDGPTEHIPAKDAVEKIIIEAGLPGHSFSDSTVYISWETDRIIGSELWRNMGLCLVCVFLITLVMLADIKICFMVMTCVLFTMVAVTGGLYFWNQAIDAFVCIHLVICIGLCVDYSAHVAHAFIVAEGTSVERSAYGFTEMGSAIFHGGTTTFVALSFLGLSESMIFVVFFKVFILTVIVGLFHGLIYLPVVLAVFGSDRIVKMEAEEFSKESNGMAAAAAAATKSHSNGITNPEFVLGESA